MRVARLHGVGLLKLQRLDVPEPAASELLVEIEANGVCATDARKYRVGGNDGEYPFNPGHEWLGRVVAVASDVSGWQPGDRVYGDTYGGYAEYATISVDPAPWSAGPIRVPEELPLERAIFIEPLADCLHAVIDQARVSPRDCVLIVGAGAMGLQAIAAAKKASGEVAVLERIPERRRLAEEFGASLLLDDHDWAAQLHDWTEGRGADSVLLIVGVPELVDAAVASCRTGGRVVLFAGFGEKGRVEVDLNDIHYREVSLVGSEWIGTPPNHHRRHYREALELLNELPLERLVTARIGFDDLEECFVSWLDHADIKRVFYPKGAPE